MLHTHTHKYTHAYTHMHTNAHTYIYTHNAHTHTTHMHTHAHTIRILGKSSLVIYVLFTVYCSDMSGKELQSILW